LLLVWEKTPLLLLLLNVGAAKYWRIIFSKFPKKVAIELVGFVHLKNPRKE